MCTRVSYSILLTFCLFFFLSPLAFATTPSPKPTVNHQDMQMYMSGSLQVMKDGKGLPGVLVTYNGQQVQTNDQGVAGFENLMAGPQLIQTFYHNESLQQTIMINGPNTIVTYNKGFVFTPINQTASSPLFQLPTLSLKGLFIVLAGAVILFIILFIIKKKLHVDAAIYQRPQAVAVVAFLFILIALPLTVQFLHNTTNPNSHAAGILPVPTTPTVERDDHNAILTWDTHIIYYNSLNLEHSYASNPNPGYVVYWGQCANQDPNCPNIINPAMKLTQEGIIQLQPLVDNTWYGAYIETVGFDGSVSAPTPMVKFQTDPTRVNTLRSQMTGFFDDFNTVPGVTPGLQSSFDETKWNMATSGCVGQDMASQFINTQYHAHNRIFDNNCDRGQVISRPRAIFDFSNATANNPSIIAFDMDGAGRRDTWYLDLTPDTDGIIDNPGHIALDADDPGHTGAGNSMPTVPNNTVRFLQSAKDITLHVFDQQGWEVSVGDIWPAGSGQHPFGIETSGLCGNDLRFCANGQNLETVKNVRRHWLIKIYQDGTNPATIHLQTFINNTLVSEAAHVPFLTQKAIMNWVLFSYNTPKSNELTSLLHWDAFGFTGPTPSNETHNYTNGLRTPTVYQHGKCTDNFPIATNNTFCTGGTTPYLTTVKIPDSLQGASAARLMYTVQMPGSNIYNYNSGDTIQINGKTYTAPDPSSFSWNVGLKPSGIMPEPVVLTIPLSDLGNIKTGTGTSGDNSITFRLSNAGIINVHMEFDFPKAQAPAYTQPQTIWGYTIDPNMNSDGQVNDIGPAVIIESIGGTVDTNGVWHDGAFGGCCWTGGLTTDPTNGNVGSITNPAPAVSGTVPIYAQANGGIAMEGTGSNPGVSEFDLIVDRQRVFAHNTHATIPSVFDADLFQWDTTQLCNGVHEVFPLAYNPNGTESAPDYFQGDYPLNGGYQPIFIKTNNAGQTACSPLGSMPSILTLSPAFPLSGGATPTPTTPINSTITPTSTPTTTLPTTTPINTPVPTQIPSPTITPSSTSLSLVVKLHGLGNGGDNANASGGNIAPLHTSRPILVSLFNSTNQQVTGSPFAGTLTYDYNPVNQTGTKFFLSTINLPSSVSNGFYTVKVLSPGFLSSTLPSVISVTQGSVTVVPTLSLITADVNGDNTLDLRDYNMILNNLGTSFTSSSVLPNADITDDGVVDIRDLNQIIREFSVQSGN